MKPTVLAIGLGTSCDFRLLEYVITPMIPSYNIVYIGDIKHKAPNGCKGIYYRTPDFLVTDPELPIANTSKNIFHWALLYPSHVVNALQFYTYMKERIMRAVDKYKPIAMMVMYPALGIVCRLPDELLDKCPMYIYYYAPAFVNNKIPWLFDSVFTSPSFELYKEGNEEIAKESGFKYLKRIFLASGNKIDILKKMTHIMCWDKNQIPVFQCAIEGLRILKMRALLPQVKKISSWKEMPIPKGKDIIFMSFGTYSELKELGRVISYILETLEEYCKKNNAVVLYHLGQLENKPWLYNYKEYIPYEYIVPRSKLVVFAGSLCLQNLCLYHKVPMLFVPLLTEQFFWAKNYKHFTGVNFVNYREKENIIDMSEVVQVNDYIKRVSKSMRNSSRYKMIDIAKDVMKKTVDNK